MNRRNFLAAMALAASSPAPAATQPLMNLDEKQIRRIREQLEERYRGPKHPGFLLRQGTITINDIRKQRGYKPL